MDIEGTRALITGGASGIGYADAELLLRKGAEGVVIVDISEERAVEAAGRLRTDTGGRVEAVAADVSDADAWARIGEFARDRLGGIDLLFNNAGVVFHSKPLWETPKEMVDWSFGVNTIGELNGIREFVPDMIARRHGHIVNTSSTAGFQVRKTEGRFQGLYAATKFAVVAISEALREDLAEYGVGVTVVAPSSVNTSILFSDRVRPEKFGGPTTGSSPEEHIKSLAARGMDPELVARFIIDAVEQNRLYVFTHAKDRAVIDARNDRILADLDASMAALGRLAPEALP